MNQPGRTAYRGFEYQIQVSVWLSLEFLINSLSQDGATVVVEPLEGEDLEILQRCDLDTDTSGKATGLSATMASAARYLVQIKAAGAGSWPPGALEEMLVGPKAKDKKKQSGRKWPLETLKQDARAAFLFVTDATVSPSLKPFLVDTPVFTPRPIGKHDDSDADEENNEGFPKSLRLEPDELRGRVGLVQMCPIGVVASHVDKILARKLHVPHAKREGCRKRLAARVREAMLDESKGALTAEEIRAVAREHGGLPEGPSPFVEPHNFDELRQRLNSNFVLLLLGEPGVGKTTAAERLLYEHQTRDEPFYIVKPGAPRDLRSLERETEPTLIYVEDPFGRFDPADQGHEWSIELDRLCQHVRSDIRLLITSRTSFAAPHLGPHAPNIRAHRVQFEEGRIDGRALLKEYLEKARFADSGARGWIEARASLVVEKLTRPISYSNFVGRAAKVPVKERTDERLERLASESAVVELGKELEETFKRSSPGELRGLAAVWLALAAWPYASEQARRLQQFEDDLLDIEGEVSGALGKLREHRWLRLRLDVWQMHPIYLEACLNVLKKNTAITGRVVEHLMEAHLARNDIQGLEDLLGATAGRIRVRDNMAARIREGAREILRRSAHIDKNAQSKEDCFAAALTLLAEHGQRGEHSLDALAAALCRKPGYGRKSVGLGWGFPQWLPPNWDTNTAARVNEDPDTAPIVRAFVRRGLPTLPSGYFRGASSLVDFLYGLADVSAEFDHLAITLDDFDYFEADVVAAGAIRSKTVDVEKLISRAIKLVESAEAWASAQAPVDEDSYAASDWLSEEYQRHIGPAHALIDAILDQQARMGKHDWAASRTEPVIFERFVHRVRNGGEKSVEVIRCVLSVCPGHLRAAIVEAAAVRPDAADQAIALLQSVPSHDWPRIMRRWIAYHLDDDEAERRRRTEHVRAFVMAQMAALAPYERVALTYDFLASESTRDLGEYIRAQLDDAGRSAIAALASEPGATTSLCIDLLKEIADSPGDAAERALIALACEGRPVEALIEAWLNPTGDVDRAIAALDAAACLSQTVTMRCGSLGLEHDRARVRKHALSILAAHREDECATEAILTVLKDPTASVRIFAADALAGRASSLAWMALVGMLRDNSDTSDAANHGYGWHDDEYEPEYGVAVAAAHALTALKPWPAELQKAVDEFLASAAATRTDVRRVFEGVRELHQVSEGSAQVG
ncbi:hypothetical protein [Polyangium fumosum]|uniref:AAA+ ATPase domain-containing protein n=1 Tax=Polyangium fumosum TaxID=889272 RepID=A0A4U1IVK9_9BACT|nr:hypothetical protein [Polyangium fumosum]TKC98030.1 hypothetical protein E8A74_42975 [Polyangium fumosum]